MMPQQHIFYYNKIGKSNIETNRIRDGTWYAKPATRRLSRNFTKFNLKKILSVKCRNEVLAWDRYVCKITFDNWVLYSFRDVAFYWNVNCILGKLFSIQFKAATKSVFSVISF